MKFSLLLGINFAHASLRLPLNLLALRALRFVLVIAPYLSLVATFCNDLACMS